MKKQQGSYILIAVLLVLAAAISRVVMYPHNFSPMIGMALFGGAVIKDKKLAFLLPLLAMLLSDVMFEVFNIAQGFWGWGQLIGYGIFALVTIMAFSLKKINVGNVILYSLSASIIFFTLSNLSFFLIDNRVFHLYSQDASGLRLCFTNALPFFRTSVVADLVYSTILFGSYYLLTTYVIKPKVEEARA